MCKISRNIKFDCMFTMKIIEQKVVKKLNFPSIILHPDETIVKRRSRKSAKRFMLRLLKIQRRQCLSVSMVFEI